MLSVGSEWQEMPETFRSPPTTRQPRGTFKLQRGLRWRVSLGVSPTPGHKQRAEQEWEKEKR